MRIPGWAVGVIVAVLLQLLVVAAAYGSLYRGQVDMQYQIQYLQMRFDEYVIQDHRTRGIEIPK